MGVAICTIMCMQAAVELTQPNLRLSQAKVAQILDNAPEYKAAGHTGVDDILDSNMFNDANGVCPLKKVFTMQGRCIDETRANNQMYDMLDNAERMAQDMNRGIGVVVTKTPESMLVYIGPDETGQTKYLFVDSHKRPGLDGVHILSFNRKEDLMAYLLRIFYVEPGVRDVFMYT